MSQTTPQDSKPMLLVSATYDSQKRSALLKFYDADSQTIVLWEDNTGHRPYCYSKLKPEELNMLDDRNDVIETKRVKRNDLLTDDKIDLTKIIVADPLAVGGSEKGIRNIMQTWESDIKYYENYLYDECLTIGKYYSINGDKITPHELEISKDVQKALDDLLQDKEDASTMVNHEQFQDYTVQWARLLNQPIPKIKRLALDIEVEAEIGRIPDPKIAEKAITAVGFCGTGGFRKVLILRRPDVQRGVKEADGFEIEFFDQEKEMIQRAFEIVTQFPFVLTYNGDDFDMPYLYHRADKLGIRGKDNPLYLMRDSATLKHGVHIDLYKTFSNRSYQIYAFSAKYTDFALNTVSKALLQKEKIDYGVPLDELTLYQTANYCFNDALLTLELTTFSDEILMNLLVVITRIAKMPIDDISRLGVSQWIRSLLYYEHRVRDALIPRKDELEDRSEGVTNDAIIKDKKYRGGLVIEPVQGIHFDVTVMDFASLYPSIIKVKNLSYETVRCPHDECKKNMVPDTNHWVCTKRNGLTSLVIGSLRDLRVNYYKSLSKNQSLTETERSQYTVVSQALKVILNASYGVMGAEIFPLYFLPAAEATTAIGRYIIMQTIKACESADIKVLYGDTDSLFIKKPTKEQIEQVIEHAKRQHGVDLEVDKEYRYVVLSERKKNYFGVTKSGKVDVKGLTGKKSHTPPIIRNLFYELIEMLSSVKSTQEFNRARSEISNKITKCAKRIESKEVEPEELAFNVMISKSPEDYIKTVPQHIKAAKLNMQGNEDSNKKGTLTTYIDQTHPGALTAKVRKIDQTHPGALTAKVRNTELKTIKPKKGDIISYVKTLDRLGVKPVKMAKKNDIDSKKYIEFMQSTLEQITSSMNLDFDTMLGKTKQTGINQYFWGE